ncbi:MAG: hypothetical protein E4H11_01180, partial [Myxococcales bacterium]
MLHPAAARSAWEERMSQLRCVVVVGGSLAGLRTAEALRRLGYQERLVLVGEEPRRPYDRPPLSKEFLRGERDAESIALAKPDRFDALGLELRLGRRAVALDPRARELALDDGERIHFDGCVLATGCRPRRLPRTPELAGIHLLRTLDDALAIRADEAAPDHDDTRLHRRGSRGVVSRGRRGRRDGRSARQSARAGAR